MKKINDQELLKVSELAKAAGVSPSTIHYYVQEGLLTPPTRTSRNMAYYNPLCIQEIRQIQELQSKQYLPLSAIKLLMQAKINHQPEGHLTEMKSFMENIYRPLENKTSGNISAVELAAASGLSELEIKALEDKGLISPSKNPSVPAYDDVDLRIAQMCRKLAGFGLKLADLDYLIPYVEAIRVETRSMHAIVHRLPDHDHIPLLELTKTFNDLNHYLELRIYREEARQFHEHLPQEGTDVSPSQS